LVFTEGFIAIMKKELMDRLRNKWVLVVAAAFAVFTLTISYFGGVSSGLTGLYSIKRTIVALTSLVVYFIPIIALTVGMANVVDEKERGTLDIYLTSPITYNEFLLGKFSGLAASLLIACVGGFGIATVVLVLKAGASIIDDFVFFIVNSLVLGVVFISISFFISVVSLDRTRAVALTVFVWLFFVIIYDLLIVGVLVATKGAIPSALVYSLIFLNPVDIYRLTTFVFLKETRVFLGLATLEMPGFINAYMLVLSAGLWIGLPLFGSFYLFRRKYIS